MHDFDNILLTFSEKLTLVRFIFRKRIPEESLHASANALRSYGLIQRNYSDEINEIGERIPDGTYSPSDLCRRYRAYQRQQFFKTKLPVIISIIALIGAYRTEIHSLFVMMFTCLKKFF